MSTWLCVHQLGSCPPKQFSPEASQVHWGQNASQVGDPAGALLACETCGCETCTTWLCLVSCEDLLCSGESRLHKQNGAKILWFGGKFQITYADWEKTCLATTWDKGQLVGKFLKMNGKGNKLLRKDTCTSRIFAAILCSAGKKLSQQMRTSGTNWTFPGIIPLWLDARCSDHISNYLSLIPASSENDQAWDVWSRCLVQLRSVLLVLFDLSWNLLIGWVRLGGTSGACAEAFRGSLQKSMAQKFGRICVKETDEVSPMQFDFWGHFFRVFLFVQNTEILVVVEAASVSGFMFTLTRVSESPSSKLRRCDCSLHLESHANTRCASCCRREYIDASGLLPGSKQNWLVLPASLNLSPMTSGENRNWCGSISVSWVRVCSFQNKKQDWWAISPNWTDHSKVILSHRAHLLNPGRDNQALWNAARHSPRGVKRVLGGDCEFYVDMDSSLTFTWTNRSQLKCTGHTVPACRRGSRILVRGVPSGVLTDPKGGPEPKICSK